MPETARRARAMKGQLELLELAKTDLMEGSTRLVNADRQLDELTRRIDRDINSVRRNLRRVNGHDVRAFRRLELVTTPQPWDGRTERRRHDRRQAVAA